MTQYFVVRRRVSGVSHSFDIGDDPRTIGTKEARKTIVYCTKVPDNVPLASVITLYKDGLLPGMVSQ